MNSTRPSHRVSGLATAALAGALGLWNPAWAAEYHFVVQDAGEKRAVWVPQEDPTDRTHAFAAYGLFEEVMGVNGAIITKPLRVNVTAEDTVRVQISTAQFVRLGRTFDYLQEQEEEQFPFFCPLHKGDAHLGGTIRVVP